MWLCILVISSLVAASYADRQIVEVENAGKGSTPTDLTGTGLTRGFCVVEDKECPGNEVEQVKFSATLRGCRIGCSQNVKCLSATYTADKKCHQRGARCPPGSLTDAPGATTLYRLKEGETCPDGQAAYVEKEYNYSGKFCMWEGKACPGRNLYNKPLDMATYEDCLLKCAKIISCGGADFKNGKCSPKESPMCEDEELVDDPDMLNFLRLENGVNSCPGVRKPPPPLPTKPPTEPPTEPTEGPDCKPKSRPADCTGDTHTYTHRYGECCGNDIAMIYGTLDACQTACNNDCRCKSIHHRGNECFLKNYACTNDELTKGPGCLEKQYHDYVKV